MRRIYIPILLVFCLVFCCSGFSVSADESETVSPSVYVYVTLVTSDGAQALAHEEISVTDVDSDGVLTVGDALFCTHELKFADGASGYAVSEGVITTLWGEETNGECFLNHLHADVAETVENGDRICVSALADATYCYFDTDHVSVTGNSGLTLTLVSVEGPIEGATVLIDGVSTAYVTDEDGKVTITFDGTGYCIVSAQKEGANLIPPVCAVAVSSNTPPAGDGFSLPFWVLLGGFAVLTLHGLKKHPRAL